MWASRWVAGKLTQVAGRVGGHAGESAASDEQHPRCSVIASVLTPHVVKRGRAQCCTASTPQRPTARRHGQEVWPCRRRLGGEVPQRTRPRCPSERGFETFCYVFSKTRHVGLQKICHMCQSEGQLCEFHQYCTFWSGSDYVYEWSVS